MEQDRWKRQNELFDRARGIAPERRRAFLEQACPDDPALIETIEGLLNEHDQADDPIFATVLECAEQSIRIPERVGHYRILRWLGEGGMGIVFEAQQDSPSRAVALKVMRGGAFIDEVRLRMFQREAQSLGRLRHPNIAAIYEAGRTDDGQHFFAMELVRGEPLDVYVRGHGLSLRARLELMLKICGAVHYAHQRGVIHRDLKPTNILIDGEGQPKLLDFGLARITDADVAITIATEVGKIQGTLPYMSPEQARGNPDEIDVRSDVYSLGVILYELMTGQLPYEVRQTALTDALRTICDAPPRRPSTIVRTLRGDIETIALKALEKDPARRYQGADGIAEDIRRHLADEPILARPPSTAYQVKKIVARHRGAFVAAGSLLGLLVAAVVVSTTLYVRAEKARDRASIEAASARRVTDFLIDMFRQSDPGESPGETVTARDVLEAGVKRIDALNAEPQIQVRMMTAMGRVQQGLGLFDASTEILQRAHATAVRVLGDENPDTLASAVALCDVLITKAREKEAEPLIRQVVEVRARTLGREHPETLDAKQRLPGILVGLGRMTDAYDVQREVLEAQQRILGPDHEQTQRSMGTLAGILGAQGKVDESRALEEQLLALRRRKSGLDHPDTLKTMGDLANTYSALDRNDEAAQLYAEALERQRRVLGDEHLETLMSLGNLSILYLDNGRVDEAEPLLFELMDKLGRLMGKDHPFTRLACFHVARVHIARHRWAEAESLLRRALAGTWDDHDFQTQMQRIELGIALTGLKRCGEAEPLLLAAHEVTHAHQGEQRARYERQVLEALIALYQAWGRPAELARWKQELAAL